MLTTLSGPNSYLLKAELKRRLSQFVELNGDMALEQIDAEDASLDRVREALQSMPFLSDKKLVVLRNSGLNKDFTVVASQLLKDVPDVTDVLLVEPAIDRRTAYAKFLQKQTDFTEFKELDESGLAAWLCKAATSQGGEITIGDARYLITRVGANQRLLSNELAKLLSYSTIITKQSIDLLTETLPHSTVFNMLEAAFAGNRSRALSLYKEQRQLGEEPQKLLAMIVWQLHILAVVKTAGLKAPNQIAAQSKLSPYTVQKSQAITRAMKLGDLKLLIHVVLELDIQLKSQPISADEAIQNLLITISS